MGDLTSAFNFAKVDRPFPSLAYLSNRSTRDDEHLCDQRPLDLATSSTNSLKKLEQTTVATYPVKVNSRRPPQEPGKARAP